MGSAAVTTAAPLVEQAQRTLIDHYAERRKKMLELTLLGKRTAEIARICGCSRGTYLNEMKRPEIKEVLRSNNVAIWAYVQSTIDEHEKDLRTRLAEMSSKAIETIDKLMDSDNEHVAFKAAATVLDRNPETSVHHKVDQTTTSIKIDAAFLRLAAAAATEMDAPRQSRAQDVSRVLEGSALDGAQSA
jgi:hypothetical protein